MSKKTGDKLTQEQHKATIEEILQELEERAENGAVFFTVADLAEVAKISKQAIYKKIKNAKKNNILLSDDNIFTLSEAQAVFTKPLKDDNTKHNHPYIRTNGKILFKATEIQNNIDILYTTEQFDNTSFIEYIPKTRRILALNEFAEIIAKIETDKTKGVIYSVYKGLYIMAILTYCTQNLITVDFFTNSQMRGNIKKTQKKITVINYEQ